MALGELNPQSGHSVRLRDIELIRSASMSSSLAAPSDRKTDSSSPSS